MSTQKQRREAARRKLERQLEARQERARRRRRGNLIASVVGALVVVGVLITFLVFTGNDKKSPAATGSTPPSGSTSASVSPPAAAAAAKPYPCAFTKSATPAAKKATVPTDSTPPKKGTVDLAVKTSRGNLTIQLDRAFAPCAVESFESLATQGYYDRSPCHRLVTSGIFVLQCGDPLGTGAGGPGYTINDEYTGKENYARGVVAMANTGSPNSSGGQFFIMTKDSNTGLGKTYSVVGKVTSGMGVVDKVAAGGVSATTGDGKPKLPISIESMTKK